MERVSKLARPMSFLINRLKASVNANSIKDESSLMYLLKLTLECSSKSKCMILNQVKSSSALAGLGSISTIEPREDPEVARGRCLFTLALSALVLLMVQDRDQLLLLGLLLLFLLASQAIRSLPLQPFLILIWHQCQRSTRPALNSWPLNDQASPQVSRVPLYRSNQPWQDKRLSVKRDAVPIRPTKSAA